MTESVIIRADGREFSGWTESRVEMDIRAIAWSFNVTMTRPIPEVHGPMLKKGQLFELFIGSTLVMTGRIDEIAVSYDESTVSYDVAGRSLTGQLVDSAAIHPGSQFTDMPLPDIARALCEPFDIDVVVNITTAGFGVLRPEELDILAPFASVRIEQGESVFELLERLARQRGILLTTNAQGALVMTRTGNELISPALRLGVNIKRCRAIDSMAPRASRYIIKGSGAGLNFSAGDSVGQAVEIVDPDITLHRPRIVICEAVLSHENAAQRGQWQRCRDLGSSNQAEYTLTGWSHDNGLYRPNTLATVDDALSDIHGQRLIVAVTLSEGDDGRLATLTVQPPEALVITQTLAKNTLTL